MKDLVVLGTGNIDIVRLIEDINDDKKIYNFLGFLEKNESLIGTEILGYPVLGNDDYLDSKFSHCAIINNIMNTPQMHKIIAKNIYEKYRITNLPNLIHPSINRQYVTLGNKGNIIYKSVDLATRVKIGNFNIMYPGTNIGHETEIGDSNLFALNVTVGARTHIGDENVFGNSSTISLGINVGNENLVGVGSVVIRNIYNNESLLGNPAVDQMKFLKLQYKFTRNGK
jgi:UDP-3-O-[3-hydroxymyristoyl] glucosamine N-acyltransferase